MGGWVHLGDAKKINSKYRFLEKQKYCIPASNYIIPTDITSLVISTTQLAGGLLLKMLKYFELMLNIFELSHVL